MSYHSLDVDLRGYEMFDSPARRVSRKKKRSSEIQRQRETANAPTNISLMLHKVTPKTENQEKLFSDFYRGKHVVSLGCAGTGKSFVSLYLALSEIMNNPKTNKKRLIIVRSSVASRDQGFLPGNVAEKMKIFETPYVSICKNLFGRSDAYEILKKKGVIQFESTSFMRGETFDDAIVLYDEVQNNSWSELITVVTRLGDNSKLMIAGDYGQNDLNKSKYDASGLGELMKILNRMKEVSTTYFGVEDIVRSGFVRNFYRALYHNEPSEIALPSFVTNELPAVA